MGKKKNKGKQREDSLESETRAEGDLPSRRKSKKDRLADPFFDEVVPEEDTPSVQESKPPKSTKSKNAFEALDAESSDEEEATDTQKHQSGNAFSAFLEDDDDDDDDDVDSNPERNYKPNNSFALLNEDEEDVEEEVKSEKKKSKKKKKKGSFAMGNVFDELLQEESELKNEQKNLSFDEIPEPVAKPKSKKKQDLFDAAFAELEQEETNQEETPATKPKKDKKKKKTKTNFDDLLMELEAEDNGESVPVENNEETKEDLIQQTNDAAPVIEEVETPVPVSKPKDKKKKKKGGGKTKEAEEDIDALLAEIEGKNPSAPSNHKPTETYATDTPITKPVESEPPQEASKSFLEETSKPKKSLLEETSNTEKSNLEETRLDESAVVKGPLLEAPEEEELVEKDETQEEDAPEVKLTAAQKKKQRKKDKKAREKEKQAATTSEDSKDKKKLPAHVRKIQEQLEKKRLEDEKRRQEEEAEKQRLAEEERLRQEEEQRKEEEAKRKAEEKARREELKKEGKILTKKQKAEQARLAAVREQLLKSSGLNVASGASRPAANPQEQKRIQREREEAKRKAEAERLQAEEEQRQLEEQAEKKRQAELEAQHQAEEEQRRKEAEEAEIADNWEDITEEEEEEAKPTPDDQDEKQKSSESDSESETESESDSESETSSSAYSTDSEEERERQIQAAKQKAEARIEEARAAASSENLRSPICCILGHVDTGKTKILDNIRKTNVQDNEAGGITQQIGATYIPSEALLTRTNELRKGREYEIKVPGLLVIDTPGHESFTNLRTRGSSLCDIAILVVDLMHGLEAQTLESIELLRQKKTPFIIALNKVDRINDWKVVSNAPIRESLNRQKKHTLLHYEDRLQACSTMLMERGLNVALYWKNKEPRKIVNMVPTSAITGEGICDMLQLLIKLTTSLMAEKLMFLSEVQCSVLEVKAIEGLGTTVDVVLVNGQLNEGDKIVVCGMSGPIVTNIRSLLTPHPLKELRVKGSYLHHKSIQAAQGIKICAQNLEQAVAGTALRVVREGEEEECKLLAIEEMEDVLSRIDKTGEGVSVQASTLGSLEALLEFLKSPEVQIPVSAIGIGPIHKKDVMRANVMNEKKIKKFAVILAFDVPVTKEARELSEELNVKVFTADIIYHLFDQFKAYVEEVRQAEKRAASADAVFPCVLEIIPTCIFNKKDPIVLGCEIIDGQARIGTPLVVPAKPGRAEVSLGKIESMELNHKAVERADRGDNVAIKLQSTNPEEASRLYGRHFDHTDQLYSKITRDSINALKAFFRDEMTTPDWNLVIKLKKIYQIE